MLSKKAIAINPAFAESYELLAYINLVNQESYDESLAMLKTALKYQPGNQRYAMRMAEILVRQNKLVEATAIADKIAKTTDDPETKERASSLVSEIERMQQYAQRRKESEAGERNGSGPPSMPLGRGGEKLPRQR
jgi:thioredoxin-like negative regulator of GroEL